MFVSELLKRKKRGRRGELFKVTLTLIFLFIFLFGAFLYGITWGLLAVKMVGQ